MRASLGIRDTRQLVLAYLGQLPVKANEFGPPGLDIRCPLSKVNFGPRRLLLYYPVKRVAERHVPLYAGNSFLMGLVL